MLLLPLVLPATVQLQPMNFDWESSHSGICLWFAMADHRKSIST